jgi:pyridoxamine 5'-phosphate oxidase
MEDLSSLRQEYAAGGLSESDLAADPITMFGQWMDAVAAAGLHEPNAMVVATVAAGAPSARMVLLKELDERGFVFFTNYGSRKAGELDADPACALLFPWHVVERQVRVEGLASRLTEQENAAYFATRPRAAQLGAWASPQSRVVASRGELDERYDEVTARFADQEVPLPPSWGGFRVEPETVEFWQGRRGRMHDRLRYRRTSARPTAELTVGAGWVIERLAP